MKTMSLSPISTVDTLGLLTLPFLFTLSPSVFTVILVNQSNPLCTTPMPSSPASSMNSRYNLVPNPETFLASITNQLLFLKFESPKQSRRQHVNMQAATQPEKHLLIPGITSTASSILLYILVLDILGDNRS